MTRKNYQVDEVIRSLSRKKDIQITGGAISILNNTAKKKTHDIGNKSWGKIDFLVNYCGYFKQFVNEFK